MPSVTSFFSPALYRKNLTRFWPLWALYTLCIAYILPLNLLNETLSMRGFGDGALEFVEVIPALCGGIGVFLAAVFGIFSAMAVYSYLYRHGAACAMHALPLRRSTLFFTNWLSGLSFLVLPNIAVGLITLVMELFLVPQQMGLALRNTLIWLVVQSALCLFFFSFATLCAMLTGNILALPSFYVIFNFLALGVTMLMEGLCEQFLCGFTTFSDFTEQLVLYLTPSLRLAAACEWDSSLAGETFRYGLESPLILAVYSGIAVLLALVAWELYRFRHIETAGDVISVPLLRPIFKYSVAFCSGLSFGCLTAIFFGLEGDPRSTAVFVVLWSVIGFFVAEMFLRKSLRVGKAWKGAVAVAAVMTLLSASLILDWYGFETRIPDAQDVARVTVDGMWTRPSDYGSNGARDLTDPDVISAVLDLHQGIVNNRNRDVDGYGCSIALYYELTNGETFSRSYSVPLPEEDLDREGTPTFLLNRLLRTPEYIRMSYTPSRYEGGELIMASVENWADLETNGVSYDARYAEDVDKEDLRELWDAVQADMAEGKIGNHYLFEDSAYRQDTSSTILCLQWALPQAVDDPSSPKTRTDELRIALSPRSEHTLDWLEEHGVLDETHTLLTQEPEEATGSFR